MSTPSRRVEQLLARYDRPDARVAELLCDRHDPDATALTVVEPDLAARDVTFGELRDRSARFAVALAGLGVGPGDRVATLMGKSADLVAALLGIWRRGAVHVPLFTAFAPPAIEFRLAESAAKVVVADPSQRDKLAAGHRVVTAGAEFGQLLAAHQPTEATGTTGATGAAVAVGGGGEFVRLFTSGTTGTPKGVAIPVRALASFVTYFEYGLGVEPDDVFWNMADPGWAYGLYYGIIAPLAAGHRSLLLRAGFSAELTYRVLSRFQVTNFAAAPTVFRALRADPTPIPGELAPRRVTSAGEPLNPEMVAWSERHLGVPIHDTYGQTELGMCLVNGWHPDVAGPVKPGSMGRAMPGWSVEVLREDRDEIAAVDTVGRVAVDVPASPLMWFTGYANNPEKTAERFSADGRWYYTGDAGRKDADGYLFFSARDDDVIIMAGYRIGPFEVESALVGHPDVVEAAVIGAPDPLRGEVLEAYVVLRDGVTGSEELADELRGLVRRQFAAHAYPRAVHFVAELPKTPSGKVQRFVLRDQRRKQLAEHPE